MLLTENIEKSIDKYNVLKLYDINIEKVTNIYYRIFLQSNNIIIRLDIEEQEFYIHFMIKHNIGNDTFVYHALSDSSDCYDVEGIKQPIFANASEEAMFIKCVRKSILNHKKPFSKDKNGNELVNCILSFINDFVSNLQNSSTDGVHNTTTRTG